jgi:hypothetical protein
VFTRSTEWKLAIRLSSQSNNGRALLDWRRGTESKSPLTQSMIRKCAFGEQLNPHHFMSKTEIPLAERYGFILIDTPELKEKYAPKLNTDFSICGCRSCQAEARFTPDSYNDFQRGWVYRRAVPMPDDYRLVGLDEILLPTDEFESVICGKWITANCEGNKTVRQHITDPLEYPSVTAFRRRKVGSSVGWVSSKSKPPEKGKAVWWFSVANPGVQFCQKVTTPDCVGEYFWQYAEIPQHPQPTPSPADEAFEKALAQCEEHARKHGDIPRPELGPIGNRTLKRARMFFDAGVAFATKGTR